MKQPPRQHHRSAPVLGRSNVPRCTGAEMFRAAVRPSPGCARGWVPLRFEATCAVPVPQGRSTIAQRFIAGIEVSRTLQAPEGAKECSLTGSSVPSGLEIARGWAHSDSHWRHGP
jgi:hypothetical protein